MKKKTCFGLFTQVDICVLLNLQLSKDGGEAKGDPGICFEIERISIVTDSGVAFLLGALCNFVFARLWENALL